MSLTIDKIRIPQTLPNPERQYSNLLGVSVTIVSSYDFKAIEGYGETTQGLLRDISEAEKGLTFDPKNTSQLDIKNAKERFENHIKLEAFKERIRGSIDSVISYIRTSREVKTQKDKDDIINEIELAFDPSTKSSDLPKPFSEIIKLFKEYFSLYYLQGKYPDHNFNQSKEDALYMLDIFSMSADTLDFIEEENDLFTMHRRFAIFRQVIDGVKEELITTVNDINIQEKTKTTKKRSKPKNKRAKTGQNEKSRETRDGELARLQKHLSEAKEFIRRSSQLITPAKVIADCYRTLSSVTIDPKRIQKIISKKRFEGIGLPALSKLPFLDSENEAQKSQRRLPSTFQHDFETAHLTLITVLYSLTIKQDVNGRINGFRLEVLLYQYYVTINFLRSSVSELLNYLEDNPELEEALNNYKLLLEIDYPHLIMTKKETKTKVELAFLSMISCSSQEIQFSKYPWRIISELGQKSHIELGALATLKSTPVSQLLQQNQIRTKFRPRESVSPANAIDKILLLKKLAETTYKTIFQINRPADVIESTEDFLKECKLRDGQLTQILKSSNRNEREWMNKITDLALNLRGYESQIEMTITESPFSFNDLKNIIISLGLIFSRLLEKKYEVPNSPGILPSDIVFQYLISKQALNAIISRLESVKTDELKNIINDLIDLAETDFMELTIDQPDQNTKLSVCAGSIVSRCLQTSDFSYLPAETSEKLSLLDLTAFQSLCGMKITYLGSEYIMNLEIGILQ